MRRFSSSTKATCVPSLIEYLRRSFAGMTSWPLVVTVETSVFMRAPKRIRDKYNGSVDVSQFSIRLTFQHWKAADTNPPRRIRIRWTLWDPSSIVEFSQAELQKTEADIADTDARYQYRLTQI